MGKAAEITHNSNNAFGPGTANKYTVLTSANKCSILITGEKLLKIPTYVSFILIFGKSNTVM